MAEEEPDVSQKTEEPSQKRLEDAIEKGNVVHSKEVVNFVLLSLFSIFIIFLLPDLFEKATIRLGSYILEPHFFNTDFDGNDALSLSTKIIKDILLLVLTPFAIAILAALLGNVLQKGIVYSPNALIPKFSKISPIEGFKRIFSLKSLVEFTKGLIKIFIIGITAYYAVYSEIQIIYVLHDVSFATLMRILLSITSKMLIAICVLQGIIAALDFFYERHAYLNKLLMTKQEVKDEHKQSEGDPQIKSRIRAIRIQQIRRQIAASVPKADLIITNPTHYSVALQYESNTMLAPKLVAKGVDLIALRIREIGKEHDIPIVENKVLARSIYDNVELNDFIAAEHYKAVAMILTQLKKYRKKSN